MLYMPSELQSCRGICNWLGVFGVPGEVLDDRGVVFLFRPTTFSPFLLGHVKPTMNSVYLYTPHNVSIINKLSVPLSVSCLLCVTSADHFFGVSSLSVSPFARRVLSCFRL